MGQKGEKLVAEAIGPTSSCVAQMDTRSGHSDGISCDRDQVGPPSYQFLNSLSCIENILGFTCAERR